jgi:lysophospholipase L1-like esterase
MAYTAIIQRRLERDFINLGFSGSARVEEGVTDQLAELDPALYIMDFTRNTGGLTDEEYFPRVQYHIRTLRAAHPSLPMLAVADAHIRPDIRPTKNTRRLAQALEAFIHDDPLLHYFADDSFLGDDGEGTVDGTHPTDLGYLRTADALTPVIAKLLD